MRERTRVHAAVLAVLVAAVLGCPEREVPSPPSPPPSPVPKTEATAPAPAATPAEPAASAATPTATPSPKPAPKPTVTPATPAPTPAPPAAKPEPAPEPTKPAPAPAVPASSHAKVGGAKCKMCHRVQHQSWAASPHAGKGIDCEACHGNGGDYWPAAVMRDREKALAAGMLLPGLASCKACHAKADDALFARVHAHKVR